MVSISKGNGWRLRFGLKQMLVLVTLAAGVAWVGTQMGVKKYYVEVKENRLVAGKDDLINGLLYLQFARNEGGTNKFVSIVCEISQLAEPLSLLDLKVGDQSKIRYRSARIGPFPKEDPFRDYLTKKLDIPEESIVGYAVMENCTYIIINGGT